MMDTANGSPIPQSPLRIDQQPSLAVGHRSQLATPPSQPTAPAHGRPTTIARFGRGAMSNRPNQLSVYVTDERKAEIEQRANEEDTTISRLVNEMIDRYLQQEAQDAIASEVRAEERLREVITLGTETMRETTTELRELNARFGAYAAASFELQRRAHSPHIQQEALTTGVERMGQDLDSVIQDLDNDAVSTQTDSVSASDTTAPTDTNDETDDTSDTISGDALFEKLRRNQE